MLERHDARATFFMLGRNAHRHPDVVRLVASAGHAIGNHSWDHPVFPSISRRERRDQVVACSEVIAPYEQPFFRPPYTLQSVGSHLTLRWLGYQVVAWSGDSGDWQITDSAKLVERLRKRIRPGAVIVLHDRLWNPRNESAADRRPMLEAVSRVLDEFSDRFSFLTVPELMEWGRPVMKSWFTRNGKGAPFD